MVEVADVDPVGDQRRRTELDVEVTVDRVVLAEDTLVANAQVALVATDRVAVAEVHPAPDDHPAVALTGIEIDVAAEEDETLRHDVRVAQPQHEEPPVAHEIPGRVG